MKSREVATLLELVSEVCFLVSLGSNDRIDDRSSIDNFHSGSMKCDDAENAHLGRCIAPSPPLRTMSAFIVDPPLSRTTTGSDAMAGGKWVRWSVRTRRAFPHRSR